MKYKISPEDYSRILELLELDKISLNTGSIKVIDDNFKGGTISLILNEKYTFQDFENRTIFYCSFKLYGCFDESKNKKDAFFEVSAKYNVSYEKMGNDVAVEENFFEVFRDLSLTALIWPYFREFIQCELSRACIPPVVLPLRRWHTK